LHRKSLIQNWCEMYTMKYNNERPNLYLNQRELLQAQNTLHQFADGKPVLIVQTSGGNSNSNYLYSWTRDMPINQAQQVVNHFHQNGYVVLQIRDEKQHQLQNVQSLHQIPPRQLIAMISLANKRFFIDSFAQHAAAALNLKSTVVWINTNPEIFGYSMHNNIQVQVEIIENAYDKNQYLFDYDFNGPLQEYPYETLDLFNVEEIIKSIEEN
ncbi:MAG: glycosyltransferase family 9 protein, partial [Candidatus Heimdallarchaeota archaeon]